MKYISILTIVIILITINQTHAQDIEFGDVANQELEEKYYPIDSSANAAYLYKYRKTYIDGYSLVTEVHHKIKIYNKEGFDFATKKIALYKSSSDSERVSGLKAYTYNLVNNQIVKEKLEKDAIFKTEYHKRLNHFTFTMPNVKEGSIIEYKYSLRSPFLTNIDEFKFQHSIPVKKLYAKLSTPAFFKFNKKTKGFLSIIPKYSSKRDARINANVNIIEYSISDIPALEDEVFVDNIDNYKAGVEYELVAVQYTTYTKSYSQTWNDVAKTVNKYDTYKNGINKKSYYKKDLDSLLVKTSTLQDKVKKIFEFVKKKVKWNEVDGIYTYNGMTKAYKDGIGNVADINLMMISMMRYAGLQANPILLSTRDNGIPIFPTISGLNYVICGVEINKEIILLDATNKYADQDILSSRLMNWNGKLIKPDNSINNVTLAPIKPSFTSTILNVILSPNGDIQGKSRNIYKNNKALEFRKHYSEISRDDYLLEMENKSDHIEISDYKLNNLDKVDKPLMENYSFYKEEGVESVDDKMYFSPMFFLKMTKNPFVAEKRLFPIDFSYPRNKRFQIMITIPDEYTIESVPEPIRFKLPLDIGEFLYNIKKSSDNKIQLICSTKIKYSKISSDQYLFVKQFYNQIIKKETEKIVLVKK